MLGYFPIGIAREMAAEAVATVGGAAIVYQNQYAVVVMVNNPAAYRIFPVRNGVGAFVGEGCEFFFTGDVLGCNWVPARIFVCCQRGIVP